MTINDILQNRITPFGIDDIKLIKLFSYFLHNAPTINSMNAKSASEDKLISSWNKYINENNINSMKFIAPNTKIENHLSDNQLGGTHVLSRKSKACLCKLKDNKEKNYECILRHIRNSIAHCNVFMINAGNRKYIIFDDYNDSGNQSARILLSQADLTMLKKYF